MTATLYVGTSALPGRTFGKRQVMSVQPALQIIAWMNELERLLGYRFTVSEANRSRPDQRLMRNAYDHFIKYGSPWAALAALCFTSTHDELTHGDAVDMAGPGGRALTQYEHDLARDVGRRYGVIWTGETFSRPEWWHFNVILSRASIIVPRGTYISGASSEKPKPLPKPAKKPTTTLEGNLTDMFAIQLAAAATGKYAKTLPKGAQFILDTREKTLTRVDNHGGASPAQLQTLKDEFGTYAFVQPNGKPLTWSGNTAWRYIDGGYARKGW